VIRIVTAVALAFAVGCATPATTDVPETSPQEKRAVLELRTTGGIAGSGLGNLAIDGSRATASHRNRNCVRDLSNIERESVDGALRDALSVAWRESYVKDDNPYGAADQIRYELTWQSDGTTARATWWYDETRPDLPPEIRTLFETMTRIRNDMLATCPPSQQ
jgi:hypothetical protein